MIACLDAGSNPADSTLIIPITYKINVLGIFYFFTVRYLYGYSGYEGWAIVRDTGYPASAVITSDNNDIISFAGEMNGKQAQRLRYGTSVYSSNNTNVNTAISAQGPDNMTTKLWFAK